MATDQPFAQVYVAQRDGRARRGEDVEVQGQPGVRLRAAGGRASTRWPSGWRCSPTTTATTGPGPTSSADARADRLARWREAVRLDAALNADEVLVQVRAALAHDLDAPAALAAVDAWAAASLAIDGDDAGRAGPGRPGLRRAARRTPGLAARGRSAADSALVAGAHWVVASADARGRVSSTAYDVPE